MYHIESEASCKLIIIGSITMHCGPSVTHKPTIANTYYCTDVLKYKGQCVVCSVKFSVCSVQCAVCSVQCAVCIVQCAVCSVQCAVCSVQCAVCSLQWAVYTVCSMQCTIQCRVCSVQSAVYSAQCRVWCVHCSVCLKAPSNKSNKICQHCIYMTRSKGICLSRVTMEGEKGGIFLFFYFYFFYFFIFRESSNIYL